VSAAEAVGQAHRDHWGRLLALLTRLLGRDLCDEAIRLARLLVGLMPDEPEAAGLLALMLLQHARRDARVDEAGRLVLLPDQDRSRWDRGQIAEGFALLRAATARAGAGAYVLQAGIAAEHAAAATAARCGRGSRRTSAAGRAPARPGARRPPSTHRPPPGWSSTTR